MRAGRMMIAAALLGAGVVASGAPALAQGIEVEVPGVGVRVGDPDRYRERHRERERVRERRDVNDGSCRTVTEQVERPDGTMMTRSVQRCD